jgi:enamine deaminase RidA (YjgF/YER057c/UK114 family)
MQANQALFDVRQKKMSPTEKLKSLGLSLPALISPAGNYAHATRSGNLLFLAGKGVGAFQGKVGREVTLEDAQEFAKTTTLMLLAVIQGEIGSIDKVARIVKITGFVNSASDFSDHPKVMDGCSDLLIAVFGKRGTHARTSIGVSSTPNQIPIEIEAVVEIQE